MNMTFKELQGNLVKYKVLFTHMFEDHKNKISQPATEYELKISVMLETIKGMLSLCCISLPLDAVENDEDINYEIDQYFKKLTTLIHSAHAEKIKIDSYSKSTKRKYFFPHTIATSLEATKKSYEQKLKEIEEQLDALINQVNKLAAEKTAQNAVRRASIPEQSYSSNSSVAPTESRSSRASSAPSNISYDESKSASSAISSNAISSAGSSGTIEEFAGRNAFLTPPSIEESKNAISKKLLEIISHALAVEGFWQEQVRGLFGGEKITKENTTVKVPATIKKINDINNSNDDASNKIKAIAQLAHSQTESSGCFCFFSKPIMRTNETHDFYLLLSRLKDKVSISESDVTVFTNGLNKRLIKSGSENNNSESYSRK
ncbi:MAG: hypothetical protein P4M12_03395 [Gammaproteobacteria bacterium]|nr:hypothetical protein [Gammaproteobacteria bacterium]